MKNILSSLNESEKRRILEMYYTGSAKRYLAEQKIYKEGTYSYKVENNKYYYSTDDGKTWAEQTKPAGIQAIKDVIAKQGGTTSASTTTKQGGTEKTQTSPAKTQAKERVTGLEDINKAIIALNKWSMENPIKISYDSAGIYSVQLKLLTRSIKEHTDSQNFKTEFTYPYGVSATLIRSNGATVNDKQYLTLKDGDCFKTYTVDWKEGMRNGAWKTLTEKFTNLYNGWYKGGQGVKFCGYKEVTLTNTNGVSAPTTEIQNLVISIDAGRIYSETLDHWDRL
jgi:hypothetical protein